MGPKSPPTRLLLNRRRAGHNSPGRRREVVGRRTQGSQRSPQRERRAPRAQWAWWCPAGMGIAVGAGSGDAKRAGASPSASGSGGTATATDAKACGGSVGREAHATRASAGKRWSFMGDMGRWRRFVTEKAPTRNASGVRSRRVSSPPCVKWRTPTAHFHRARYPAGRRARCDTGPRTLPATLSF
jgi:hypothetical protein